MTDYSCVAPVKAPVRSDYTTERLRNVGAITKASLHDAIARRTMLASIIVTVHRDNSQRRQRTTSAVSRTSDAIARPSGVL